MEPERRALYVRIPLPAAEKLDRAAFEMQVPKQDLVADLLFTHLPVPPPPSAGSRRVVVESMDDTMTVGHHSFVPADESEDPDKDIALYINSPGGVVYAGLAIYDTMQFVKPEIQTMCVGIAMSMGSLLLAGGTPGKRYALPNSRILIHQPWGGFQGQATDIEIHAREALELRGRVDEIYAKHVGKPVEQVHDDMDRDRFFTSEEAVEYGLIDG